MQEHRLALGMETPLSLPALVSAREKKTHTSRAMLQAGAKQSNHAPPPGPVSNPQGSSAISPSAALHAPRGR